MHFQILMHLPSNLEPSTILEASTLKHLPSNLEGSTIQSLSIYHLGGNAKKKDKQKKEFVIYHFTHILFIYGYIIDFRSAIDKFIWIQANLGYDIVQGKFLRSNQSSMITSIGIDMITS